MGRWTERLRLELPERGAQQHPVQCHRGQLRVTPQGGARGEDNAALDTALPTEGHLLPGRVRVLQPLPQSGLALALHPRAAGVSGRRIGAGS